MWLSAERAYTGGATSALSNPVAINLAAGGAVAFSYEALPIFKNRVRESRGFGLTTNTSVSVPVDSSGWPTTDFGCTLLEGQLSPSWIVGTFKCGFTLRTPSDTPTAGSNGGTTVSNVVNHGGGVYTFDLTFPANATGGGFQVTGTTSGCYNIFAYLPAYPGSAIDDPTSSGAYTNEIINHLKNFRLLRVMQATGAINDTLVQSATTRQSAANTQARPNSGGRVTIAVASPLPTTGATTAKMTSNWSLISGSYGVGLVSAGKTCGRICTLTNGSPNVSWSASQALTENVTATYTDPVGTDGFPAEWWIGLCKTAGIGIWLCPPLFEDGSNYAAGSYTAAVMDALNSMGFDGEVIFETASNEIWNYHSQTMTGVISFLGFTGSSAIPNYMGYRAHALAALGRTKFGSAWGGRVKQAIAWSTTGNGLSFFHSSLGYISSTYGSVASDVQYVAIAPYCTPSIGNTDSIATIEGYILNGQGTGGSDGPRQALRALSDNIAIVAMSYGLGLVAYESGIQWNAVNSSNANVGLAIMDAGMAAPIKTYYSSLRDSPYTFACHFQNGVTNTSGNTSPTNDLSNNYADFIANGSPTLSGLLAYTGGFAPQRNVINQVGDFIDCINYADNDSSISATYPYFGQLSGYSLGPHYGVSGYLPYTFYCANSGTIGLQLTVNSTTTGATDIEVNGVVVASNVAIPNFSGTGVTSLVSIQVNRGWNYICLGRAGLTQSGVTPMKITRIT